MLALKNKHPLDNDIEFKSQGHKYLIKGSSEKVKSVTSFIDNFFEIFDQDKAIEAIMNCEQYLFDPDYRYFQMSKKDILQLWATKADEGTQLHSDIDCYYNENPFLNTTIEFNYFLDFVKANAAYEIYRTEWYIYYEKYKIAGAIDAVFRDKVTGNFVLIDWKRVDKLEPEPGFKKYAKDPISHLYDSKFSKYSLQLNLYRYILKHNYGINIEKMYLVVLHPTNKNQSFIQFDITNLETEIETMLQKRLNEIAEKECWKPIGECDIDDFSEEQRKAYDLMVKGENLFLTGSGGRGKSACVNLFYKKYRYRRNIGLTSTTGISAVLIGGSTIHSFLGIGLATASAEKLYQEIMFSRPKKIQNRWKNLDTLIIDEVSMLTPELFDKLEFIARSIRGNKKPFGGIQLILTGDFLQLPCIGSPKLCFEAEKWDECIGHNVIYLQKSFRQSDPVFQECLAEVRIGKLSQSTIDLLESRVDVKLTNDLGIEPTKIYALNRDVTRENEDRLNQLFKLNPELEFYQYEREFTVSDKNIRNAEERIEKNCVAPKLLEICVGAQVMLIYNLDQELKLVNGSRGVVIGFEGGFPKVRFMSGLEVIIPHVIWNVEENGEKIISITQIPLKVAYAVTCHRIQGSTLDLAEIDMANIFEDGMAYVALSRVKDLKGLCIRNFRPDKITANSKVVEFYDRLS